MKRTRKKLSAAFNAKVAVAAIRATGPPAEGATNEARSIFCAAEGGPRGAARRAMTSHPSIPQPVVRWRPRRAHSSAEPEFHKIIFAYRGKTNPAGDGTLKIDATGLAGHTRYFYRFVAADGTVSPTGQFVTAPRDSEAVAVRFAFSGDTHGAWRPCRARHPNANNSGVCCVSDLGDSLKVIRF
jgi:hypothetical protein